MKGFEEKNNEEPSSEVLLEKLDAMDRGELVEAIGPLHEIVEQSLKIPDFNVALKAAGRIRLKTSLHAAEDRSDAFALIAESALVQDDAETAFFAIKGMPYPDKFLINRTKDSARKIGNLALVEEIEKYQH